MFCGHTRLDIGNTNANLEIEQRVRVDARLATFCYHLWQFYRARTLSAWWVEHVKIRMLDFKPITLDLT
jgi:hypothetical protein